MRFQVPQFIEVEDKIVGPLTLKQFVYIAGGCGLSVAFFLLIPWWYLSILPIIVVMTFSLALAFYKVNNRPLSLMIESSIKYLFGSKLYVWRKEEPMEQAQLAKKAEEQTHTSASFIPKLGNSKLKDMLWTLDTRQATNPVTNDSGTNTQ